ncbi:MAG TPA: TonB-dependent receptor [Bacteroidia bacterium]
MNLNRSFLFSSSRFFLSALFVLTSLFSIAQTATVKGKVSADEVGVPVEDVQISVEGTSIAPQFSDKEGNYSIDVPAGKEITIVFSNLSYKTKKKKLTLTEGETYTINPVLSFRNEITSVDIVDEKRTTDIVRMDPTQITQLPGASMDIMRLLPSMGLGVSMTNELSAGYSVRGGNFDENLVYVNDIEVYRPFLVRSGQQEGLSFPNPDMVSNMEFSAGGFEAKYGDKLSSVLDITYRKPRKFSNTVSMSLLGASAHTEGISSNKLFSYQIGARYKTNQYLLKSIDTKGDYKPRFYDVQTLLNFAISPEWNIELLGNMSGNKYQVVPQTRETTFGTFNQALQFKVYFDGQEISQFNTYFGAISTTFKPNNKLRLKLISSVFRTFEDETFTIQGQYYINELETDLGSSNFGNVAFNRGIGTFINHGRNYLDAWVINTEHKGSYKLKTGELLWGARFQHEIINDKLSEWNYVDSAGYSIPQANPTIVELRDVIKTKINLESNRVMGYTQYVFSKELKDTSEFTLTAGVRSNYWTLNGDNVISPRVTLAIKPHWRSNWVFKASAGYYYQPPFYREMRDFYGNINKDLKAQQSIHYVLSGDLNYKMWGRPFKFITAAYYKQLDNLVPYEIDNVRIRYYAQNNSRGFATGMDFRLNGEFVKGIESWVSMSVMTIQEDIKDDYYYTYRDSTGAAWYKGYSNLPVHDSTIHYPGYIPRPTDQRVTFNLFFQDYLPKLPSCKMHLNLIYGTGLTFGPPSHEKYKDTLRMPAYRRVDIGFSYMLLKDSRKRKEKALFRFLNSAWISVEVLNLLAVNNTVSYTWVKDVTNRQYAIPNYLTNRQLNVKLQLKF